MRWSGGASLSERKDRGAVAIVVVLFILIFMVLLAFVVDLGRTYAAKAQLQNAVDAAALAAAQDLPNDASNTAKNRAVTYAGSNGVTITTGNVTTPYNGNSCAVRVAGTLPVSYIFGPFAGVSGTTVAATAAAVKGCLGDTVFVVGEADLSGGFDITGSLYAGGPVAFSGTMTITEGADVVTSASGNTGQSGIQPLTVGAPAVSISSYETQIGLDTRKAALNTLIAAGGSTVSTACGSVNLSALAATVRALSCNGNLTLTGSPPSGSALEVIKATGTIDMGGNTILQPISPATVPVRDVLIWSTFNSVGTGSNMSNRTDAIKVQSGGAVTSLWGTLYAPSGQIDVQGAKDLLLRSTSTTVTWAGRIISYYLDIKGDGSALPGSGSSGSGGVTLTE